MYKLLPLLLFFVFVGHGQQMEKRVLETLCSEELGGRGYVDGGDSLAAEFLAREFESLGLQPVGKSFFQSFPFDINTFPGALSVSINGKPLQPGVEFLIDPASGSAKVSCQSKRFTIQELLSGELKAHLVDIREKRLIPVLDPSGVTDRDTLAMLKQTAIALADIAPVVLLSDHLSWYLAQNQLRNPVIEINTTSYEEGKIEFEIEAHFKKHIARNVIAQIPSKGKAKRTLVFTAHYDHLGKMGQETYFPGANDNASGTTMLLSIASQLIQNKQENTRYLFIAFAGEEVALLGSKYFVEHPLIKLNTIDFLINLDILGGAQENITVVNGKEFPDQFSLLQEANTSGKYIPAVKARSSSANSDHHWFYINNVPCFFIYSSGDNKHYHVPEDKADHIDMNSFMSVRQLLLDFVSRL